MSTCLAAAEVSQKPLPVCLSENPYRLVSLADIMDQYRVDLIAAFIVNAESVRSTLEHHHKVEWDADLSRLWNEFTAASAEMCCALDLNGSQEVVSTARRWSSKKRISAVSVEAELRHIKDSVLAEIEKMMFVRIGHSLSEFFNQAKLFGDAVYNAFPSSREDIKASGNCISVELPTAAVFHLMRVAEIGLRALAFDRRIKIPKGVPVSLATWEEVLRELEKTEAAVQCYKKTLAREAQLAFYHGANMEFKRFKNIYRNRVSHAREEFDQHQAMSAFTNVRKFMQILATQISETRRTPIRWKQAQLDIARKFGY